jgi:hypothetical protein
VCDGMISRGIAQIGLGLNDGAETWRFLLLGLECQPNLSQSRPTKRTEIGTRNQETRQHVARDDPQVVRRWDLALREHPCMQMADEHLSQLQKDKKESDRVKCKKSGSMTISSRELSISLKSQL